jgi:hypothetical protein
VSAKKGDYSTTRCAASLSRLTLSPLLLCGTRCAAIFGCCSLGSAGSRRGTSIEVPAVSEPREQTRSACRCGLPTNEALTRKPPQSAWSCAVSPQCADDWSGH